MKSSLEEASEAAARINAMLIAKGKLKLPPVNNKTKVCSVSQKTTGDLFTAEVEINDAPLSARNMLTRGITQDEVNKFSGAAVSTRGRYMSYNDRTSNSNERPLYLHIQASNKGAVDLAVEKIHRLIERHLKNTESTMKWSRSATTFHAPPVIGSAPPPLMSINTTSVSSGQTYVQDKVFVGLEHVSPAFQVKQNLLGPADSYLNHIRIETGASITLRGNGSGFIEPTSGREAFEPLHIHLSHPSTEGLQAAKELAINLVQTTQQEFAQWQQEQTLEIINIQNQQSALGAQQAALQQRLSSTVGLVSAGGVTLGIPQDVVSTLGVPQATTQNTTLQLGSINVGGVATSISTVLPTSLATSLVTTMPSILTTNTGAQLQLVPGQVLQRTGGIVTSALPTIVQQAAQLPPVTSAAAMSLLAQSQVVYASALQQQQQSVVQASQVVASTPVPTTILSTQPQPTHLSQVVVPTHQNTATVQPNGTVAPTMFYLVTQGSVLPNQSLQVQTSPATVQLQVQESQALVQTTAQQQQQQQQQVQVQQQGQQRILQQISNTQVFTAHSFAGNVAPAVATSGVEAYPQFRSQLGPSLKRKFEDKRRFYAESYESIRSHLQQQGLWQMRPSQAATYDRHQRWGRLPLGVSSSDAVTTGLQTSMPPRLSIQGPSSQQRFMLPSPMSKTGNLTERDQHLMPPPPSPASQAVRRRRLKDGLWNFNGYGSSEEDRNGSSRSSMRQHGYMFSEMNDSRQHMLDDMHSAAAVLQLQASNSQSQYGAHHMTQQQQQQQAVVQQTGSSYAPYVSIQNIQSHQHVPSVAVSGQIAYGQQQAVVASHAQSALHYASHGQTGSPFWLAPN